MENQTVKFIFYITDESFDYGAGTCYQFCEHGFSIEFNENDFPLIETLQGFNDFKDVEKCQTLIELADYISFNTKHIIEDEYDTYCTNFRKLARLYRIIVNYLSGKRIRNKSNFELKERIAV